MASLKTSETDLWSVTLTDLFRSILLEFSKLLYKIVKAEERRKKAHLKSQEKKDEKNAAEHQVVSEFACAPAGITTPRDLLQGAVPRPVPVQPVSTRPPAFAEPVPARSAPARPVVTQPAYVQPVPVQRGPPVRPVLAQSARVPPMPAQHVSAQPGRGPVLGYKTVMSAPVQAAPVQSTRVQSTPVQHVSAPGRRPVMDYNAFMAIYGRKS